MGKKRQVDRFKGRIDGEEMMIGLEYILPGEMGSRRRSVPSFATCRQRTRWNG